jgi:hypothetical protein
MQPVAPTDMVRYAVNALSVSAQERNISLKTNLPPSLPAMME